MIILTSCSKTSGGSSSKKDETVAYATKIDLFNAYEDLIKKIPKKKYTEAYDSLSEIFKLSNKSGFVSDPKDEASSKYISNLNLLAANVHAESKIQKEKEVSFDYQQSQLSILASVASQGTQQQGQGQSQSTESTESTGSNGGSESGSTSGMEKSGGSSSSTGATGTSQQQSSTAQQGQQQFVIPEKELLEKYPELLITEKDNQIYDLSIDLLGYVTKVTLENKPDDEAAMTNREKYLLYKMNSLSKLSQFDVAKEFLLEAQNNWSKLYIKVPEKNQQDAITLNALLQNIEASLESKNAPTVEIQSKIAIELIDTLSSKMKS